MNLLATFSAPDSQIFLSFIYTEGKNASIKIHLMIRANVYPSRFVIPILQINPYLTETPSL